MSGNVRHHITVEATPPLHTNYPWTTNTVVLPATLSDVGSMIALAMNVLKGAKPPEPVRATTAAPRPSGPAKPPAMSPPSLGPG